MDLVELLGRKFRSSSIAARAGDYQLILGAGASVGAVNSYGQLPLAKELVLILKKKYPDAPISEADSLSRAYQRAVLTTSTDDVWRYLQRVFSNTSHAEWFTRLSSLPWRRVWTLNIDDTVERSYAQTLRASTHPYRTINWDEQFSETGDFEIIHLHGHVIGAAPTRLVFSFSEYQQSARDSPVWNSVLAGVLGSKPVVVLGARMLDDPDMENLLVNNRPSSGAPSIVVDPFISDGNEWELKKLGYEVLRQNGEEFTSFWQSAFELDSAGLSALYAAGNVDLPQISRLETNHVPPAPKTHNYFGGDEPLWSDACNNQVALFGWMREVISAIETWTDSDDHEATIHLLYGSRLSGISSGLLLIARECRRRHLEVVWFDKSSRLNTARFIDMCRQRGPVLLVVDNGGDFGDDFDRIAKIANSDSDIQLYILISERLYNDLKIEGRLLGSYKKRANIIRQQLTSSDAHQISAKLAEFGRLGALELRSSKERVAAFNGRDIFSAMMDVEYAFGFRKRLDAEIRGLDETWKIKLVLLTSIAGQEARQVGLVEAAFATAVPVAEIQAHVTGDEHLSALIEISNELVVSRQRDRSLTHLIELLGSAEALGYLLEMVKTLVPLANRVSRQRRNRASLLVAHLVGYRQLSSAFPNASYEEFFESLRDAFGDWSGGYWEQRAIYAKQLKDWARAESFAARAVSLYDNAYTRTTYGTILVNKAQSLAMIADDTWARFYERGILEFENAAGMESGNRVTAFAQLEASLGLLTVLVEGSKRTGLPLTPEGQAVVSDWTTKYAVLRISIGDTEGFQVAARAEKLSLRFETLFEEPS